MDGIADTLERSIDLQEETNRTLRALTNALVRAQAGMAALATLAVLKGATGDEITAALARARAACDGPTEDTGPMEIDPPRDIEVIRNADHDVPAGHPTLKLLTLGERGL